MPSKIHHGPPGSFKTAGAMADDFLREARAGRVIVTNVRGVSRDRTLEEFPDLPESFDVIHVDDKTEEGREKWAKWFHWMPKGAFIFVDEVQDIWPKRWREADIKALDYPGGLTQATKDDRPFCWEQAWDKHRHWNWDFVMTTPNYKKVRDDVKGVSDAAYKHKDLALIGWLGNYIEAMHLADDEGKSQSDFLTVQKKKVPAYVFKLYDSTATGAHRTTASGFNLFGSPRIMLLLAVLAVSLFYGFSGGPVKLFPGANPQPVKPTAAVPVASPEKPSQTNSGVPSGGLLSVSDSPSGFRVTDPFDGEGVYIVFSMQIKNRWKYVLSFANTHFTSSQISELGYTIETFGGCGVKLKKDGWERLVTCGADRDAKDMAHAAPRPEVPERPAATQQKQQFDLTDYVQKPHSV